jgi:hypothetical protein
MYPHRLRLRGPWQYEPLARRQESQSAAPSEVDQPLPAKGRMILPCRWNEGGLGSFAGRVRFQRRFGLPQRLDPFERVWLTCAGVDASAEIWLNGNFLGRHGENNTPFELPITELLEERNQLMVDVESNGNGGIWGEVALEIRCQVFLRNLRFRVISAEGQTRIHVSGVAVGEWSNPLELYVVLDRSTIAYANIESAARGQDFELISEVLTAGQLSSSLENPENQHFLRLDLVNGGTVWYRAEECFALGALSPATEQGFFRTKSF